MMITYHFWVCWFGGEVSSKIGSNVRKNQGALPVAGARREEGAAQLQRKQGRSAELPLLTAARNETVTLPGSEDKATPAPRQPNKKIPFLPTPGKKTPTPLLLCISISHCGRFYAAVTLFCFHSVCFIGKFCPFHWPETRQLLRGTYLSFFNY